MKYSISSIGQDSHAFDKSKKGPIKLGGILLDCKYSLKANSDGDVILHALTNAISGLSTNIVLGKKADELCDNGIEDSYYYVKESLSTLENIKITHVSISVELKTPRLINYIQKIRENIANILNLDISSVALTATSGEDLTAFGKGLGIQAICILSAVKDFS